MCRLRVVWWFNILLVTVLLTVDVQGEPIKVRHPRGSAHGFVVLKTLEGTRIATGDMTQVVHGDHVTSRLVFHFRDGSVDDKDVRHEGAESIGPGADCAAPKTHGHAGCDVSTPSATGGKADAGRSRAEASYPGQHGRYVAPHHAQKLMLMPRAWICCAVYFPRRCSACIPDGATPLV